MAFAVNRPGSALSSVSNDAAGFARATDRSVAPHKGFRRWAPARPVSRPNRQPATGLPGDYPDRTFTGRRRRASDQVMTAGQSPPDALGAHNFGLRGIQASDSGIQQQDDGSQLVVQLEAACS